MTREEREEAIYQLENSIHNARVEGHRYKHFELAIEALKAEPCWDCVSREAILKEMNERHKNGDAITLGYIKNLPSVTPKQKTGKWVKEETIYGWDGKSYQCSVCGRSIHLDTKAEDLKDYSYCHCGADMRGEQK